MNENEKITEEVKKKNTPKVLIVILAIVALVILIAVVILVSLFATGKISFGKGNPETDDKILTDVGYDETNLSYDKLLEIAAKNLEDGDYAAAIENYKKAMEINDMGVDAYLGLIEAYIRSNDFDKALDIAKKGYEKTGDPALKEKIDMLEEGNVVDTRGLHYKETWYDENNAVMCWYEYTFDKDGIQTTATGYGADGTKRGFVDLVSGDPNKDISLMMYMDGSLGKIVYEYENNKMVRASRYDKGDDVLTEYSEYEYDGDNRIETKYAPSGEVRGREILYYEGGKLVRDENYWFDEGEFKPSGYIVYEGNKDIYYDSNGDMEFYIVSEYDENGNNIGRTEYNPDGSVRLSAKYE